MVLVLSPLGFDKTLVAICMIYAASPASTSAYAMVYLLKGDHESMRNIIKYTNSNVYYYNSNITIGISIFV